MASSRDEMTVRFGAPATPAAGELLPLVYDELRALAARYLGRERADHTLQPTALAHETFLRLAEVEGLDWRGRAQFLALAASQIRKVLVDHARKHRAAKRGGNCFRVPLTDTLPDDQGNAVDLESLDEALNALAELSLRQAQVVELRFFAGMSVPQVAELLDVSPGTVKGDWRAARAWLRQHVTR